MGQEEFLSIFRESLAGQVPESVIQENINYYRKYIYEQVTTGKMESQVIEELGNPRLLAKTIIERAKFASGDRDNIYTESTYANDNNNQDSTFSYNGKITRLPSWLVGIIAVVVIAIVIGIVFSLISFLAPAIIFVIVAGIIIKIIRNFSERG